MDHASKGNENAIDFFVDRQVREGRAEHIAFDDGERVYIEMPESLMASDAPTLMNLFDRPCR